ncbi:multidrug transporter subunit MdtD [Acinetobacter rathckeae]|uniref:multidrug transporter subunit MdtD n=1 Tax=Acinetobacter rathckeae TaxID=2605272 RepID=UPI0018A32085|nr:multidrug transporter subunit MdtD [Acinetobacter rathckeae]MBF7686795.1 multidrug transporter subunit MdtD [Acinetobacter rathckeae]MBF7695673.1 multidrug transporter subunit MdtD [Acinetobacter rathckeae]
MKTNQHQPIEKQYRAILWLVAIGFFMQQLDSTIINTALPQIALNLHEDPLNMHAIVVAYVLAMAVTIPISGWVTDKYGLKKTYFVAIILFSTASIACALSHNLTQLIIARVFQGIGGALLQPVGRLTLLKVMPKTQLLAALSFVTIPGLIGPLIGPSLGGLLVEWTSWHWIFLMNVPIGLVGALFTLKIFPDLVETQLKPFDYIGFVLIATTMLSLSFLLEHLTESHANMNSIFILLGLAIVSAVIYRFHAMKNSNAIFAADIFNVRSFRVGILGNFFARLGNGAIPFLLPLMLQIVLNLNPTIAGLMMIPLALGSMLIKKYITRLVGRFGYRNILTVNTLLVGLGMMSFALLSANTPIWWQVIHFFLFGIVNSIQFTTMNTVTIKDLSHEKAGQGNSILSVIQQLSMSMGIALASVALNTFTQMYGKMHILQSFQYTFVCLGFMTCIASFIFFRLKQKSQPII